MLRLYPREFRRTYGDDLIQTFDDIVDDRGARTACARTALDLVITVPRYHLERAMSEHRSHATLSVAIVLLVVGGVAAMFVGAVPGVVLIVVAAVLAVAERSHLARSLGLPESNRRRRRLLYAAVSAGVSVACYVAFIAKGAEPWNAKHTVLYLVGNVAIIAAPAFLIAGLLTSRTPKRTAGATAGTVP